MPYALDLARDAHTPGREVRLLLNGLAREQFAGLRGSDELPDGLEVEFTDPIDLPGPLTDLQKFEIDHMQSAVKSFRADRMLVPTADALIRGTGACRDLRRAQATRGSDCPWDLVIHLVPAASPGRSPRSFLRSLRTAFNMKRVGPARLLTPEPYFALGPGRRRLFPGDSNPMGLLPFSVHVGMHQDQRAARRSFNLPEEGRLLVVPGMIEPRKSIHRLLSERASLEGVVDGIVFAGPIASSLREPIEAARTERAGPPLHVHDRFLGTEEFTSILQAADLVWTVYPGWHGIASNQLNSGLMGRRSLVDRSHPSAAWIAEQTPGSSVLGSSLAGSVEAALATDPSDVSFFELLTSARVRRAVLQSEVRIRSLDDLRRCHHSEPTE